MLKIKTKGTKAYITYSFEGNDSIKDVSVVGSWNDWKPELMKKRKNGNYSITKVLPAGNSYLFRYLVNGVDWENENECESRENQFNSSNSILKI